MRVLAAAAHPGPAEAVAPVVTELRDSGHDVLLVGVRNDTPASQPHGGSATVFERMGVEFVELDRLGYSGDVVGIPDSFAQGLIDDFGAERVLVGCSVNPTGRHMGIEGVLIKVGAQRSISTVQVAESWGVWYPPEYSVLPTSWAAMDELTAKIMTARGAPADRIVVTGHPGLDRYAAATSRSDDRRAELGIRDEHVFVYFGQPIAQGGSPDNTITLPWVIDALGPDDRLIFSRHPRDDRDYSGVLSAADGRLIPTQWDSDRLLAVADVALTHYSMMGLKTALLDIPTVNLVLEDDLRDVRVACGGFPMALLGGSYEVHTSEELKATLGGQLEGRAATIKKALRVDGEAAGRVARVVLRG